MTSEYALKEYGPIHDIARAVAPLLGPGWVYFRKADADGDLSWWAEVQHDDGRALHFGNADNHGKAISVSGIFPRKLATGETCDYLHRKLPDGTEAVKSISVGRTRPPAAIARDVLRRLMPSYVAQLAVVRQCIAERDKVDAERAQLAAKVAELLRTVDIRPDNRNGETRVDGGRMDDPIDVEVKVQSDSAVFTVRVEGSEVVQAVAGSLGFLRSGYLAAQREADKVRRANETDDGETSEPAGSVAP